jgi:CheY-like chemotaxis protein
MRLLFIDDDPEHIQTVSEVIRDALDIQVDVVTTVEDAVLTLHAHPYDLVITDIFIPLGSAPRQSLGPRARRYAETLQHLGGLVLLDEMDRLDQTPRVLAHTACTDFALIEILGEQVYARVPKPAPVDVLLTAVLEALDLPTPQ